MLSQELYASSSQPRVLIVEDDRLIGEAFRMLLQDEGFSATHVVSGNEALLALQHSPPQVMLLDLLLPDMHGQALLEQIQQQNIPVTVVVVTSETSATSAVDAMHAGAFDYLVKPVDENRLVTTMCNALERQVMQQRLEQFHLLQPLDQFQGFIGKSLAMQAVYRMIESAAASQASVFVSGESGTGKELCADAIHQLSSRHARPMVSINCAAIPRELLESELFGHTKGAFTGATSERKGAAAAANGGTLFFDEICDMDLDLQAKLLRFIQSKHFRRVGSDRDEITDVRFICATNRDPMTEIRAGRFREDLYYRLHVLPIALPPLRQRGNDIVMLAQHFLRRYAQEENKRFNGFSADAERALLTYPWPGNVRELQNLLHKLVVMQDGGVIDAEQIQLPPVDINMFSGDEGTDVQQQDSGAKPEGHDIASGTIRPLWLEEKEIIERAIALCDGNVIDAAKQLGISDSTIYRKRAKWSKQESSG